MQSFPDVHVFKSSTQAVVGPHSLPSDELWYRVFQSNVTVHTAHT